jgi:hypothetical protein
LLHIASLQELGLELHTAEHENIGNGFPSVKVVLGFPPAFSGIAARYNKLTQVGFMFCKPWRGIYKLA